MMPSPTSFRTGFAAFAIFAFAAWSASGVAAFAQPAQEQPPAAAPAAEAPAAAEPAIPAGEPAKAADGDKPAAEDPSGKPQQEAQPVAPPADAPSPAPAAEAATEPAPPAGPVTLTVATWRGAYGEAQAVAIFEPFEAETGYKIEVAPHDGRAAPLERQDERAGAPAWDVVDLTSASAAAACDKGLLEPIDPAILAGADGAALNDFIPGAVEPCSVASVAWSAVVIYNKGAYAKRAPSRLADFFDLKAFPGKRSLPKGPKYTMEMALMADGVEPANVYALLATPEGQIRALNKLNQIRDSVVWWEKAGEAIAHVAGETAAMGLGFNGRAFYAVTLDGSPIGIIWDGQIYDFDVWAIPKGAKNLEAARQFIAFATAPERLAAQARLVAYGPARLSALSRIGRHPEVDVDMAPFIPTQPDNFRLALALDENWWETQGAGASARFEAWLAGRPYEEPAGEAAPAEAPPSR